MKRFLAHAHCQALLDRWWRGAHKASSVTLPENISMASLLGQALFPIANPHYRSRAVELFKRRDASEISPENSRRVISRYARVALDAARHALSERKAEEADRPRSAALSRTASTLAAKQKRVQMDGLRTRARAQGGTFDAGLVGAAATIPQHDACLVPPRY
jgi:hypothetical protein